MTNLATRVNYWIEKYAAHAGIILVALYALRTAAMFFFYEHGYYADEFKDYFTTAHGLVYGHRLGEWYERTDMRSYLIIQPFVLAVGFLKLINVENIYLQFELLKLFVAILSALGLFFVYRFCLLRFQSAKIAFVAGLLFVFHPFQTFYAHSLLTEQMVNVIFLFHLYVYQYFLSTEKPRFAVAYIFALYCSALIAFAARLDALFFLAPIHLSFLLIKNKRNQKHWLSCVLTGIVAFLAIGALEMYYAGSFYGPQINRIVFEGIKRQGVIGSVSGPEFALEALAGNSVHVLFLIFLYVFIADIFKRKINIYVFPLALYAAFHFWLPHKEFRYMYPISFIVCLYLIERFSGYDFAKNVKKSGIIFILALINISAILFVLPWRGQPRLPQQIAKLNYNYPDVDLYVVDNQNLREHEALIPFLNYLNFKPFDGNESIEDKTYLFMAEQKEIENFPEQINNCKELPILSNEARKDLPHSNYLHYYCNKVE